MELKFEKREAGCKGDAKRMRRIKKIPAILYDRGKNSASITIDGDEFAACMRKVPSGHLPTTVFTLKGDDKKKRQAIVKGIDYHVTTYNILHLDFEEVKKGERVNVRVPVNCLNEVDCIGVKLGGVLRRVSRHVQVNCPADQIPEEFTIDVKNMDQGQNRKVSDLSFPEGVRPLVKGNEVTVMIVKR